MTNERVKPVELAARIAAIVLVTAATAMAACSSSDRPPASTGSGTPVAPSGPGDSGDSGSSGGPTGDGGGQEGSTTTNDCNPLPNNAPPYPLTFTTDAAPPAFVGGAIADGTYFKTSEVHYGAPSAPPPTMSPGITLTIAGSDLKFGAYTAANEYVPMAAQLRVDRADAGDPDAGDDAGTGDMLTIFASCPVAGGSLGPQPYSVVGNDLTIGFGTYTVTYTKQ